MGIIHMGENVNDLYMIVVHIQLVYNITFNRIVYDNYGTCIW